jgi:Zn-dependent M28 family amino/carboxypeptidase
MAMGEVSAPGEGAGPSNLFGEGNVLKRAALAAIVAASMTPAAVPALSSAAPAAKKADKSDKSDKVATKLANAVTVNGIMRHERALANIAERNGGTRVSGSAGFDKSRDYVVGQLQNAGWTVNVQPFEFPYFQELAPAAMERTAPDQHTYADDEFDIMEYSGSGDVTANLQAVDLTLPPSPEPNGSTSGCEAADFAGFTPGNIALVQRGTCSFGEKVANAETAGASAVVIFNEGQPGRDEVLNGTLGGPASIPAIGISFAEGNSLATALQGGTVTLHVTTSTLSETRTTYNTIADAPDTGRTDHTVVVGSHLDSVAAGPGINDDGSGSSQDVEIALQYQKAVKNPNNHLRFVFFGAEEEGLLGSTHYVDSLDQASRDDIMAMVDLDMMASPNYARFVYDGDGTDFPGNEGPTGSDIIEALFTNYWAGRGLASETIPFDGRSDYVAFTDVGIPAGGIFAGAEVIKTPEQVQRYGGEAGVAFDRCYHQACDNLANLNRQAMDEFADASAYVTAKLVMRENDLSDNTESLKAKKVANQRDYHGPKLVR